MKLAVEKDGVVKKYNLINSWSDITLEKWSELMEIKTNSTSSEAIETLLTLTDMPKKIIKELGIQDVGKILTKIAEMQRKENTNLVKEFTIEGVEYGFHPNLEQMTIGEYADIEHLIKNDLSSALPDLMSILYRPIISRDEDGYSIGAYNGDIEKRREVFKKMKGEQVQSALVFFYHFGRESLMSIQLYLMALTAETISEIQAIPSEKSGVGSESFTD